MKNQIENPSLAAMLAPVLQRPEFVPLPLKGGDPVCRLSRSFWYSAEAAGQIELVRVRLPGRQRGRVLLPVPQAIELVRRLGKGAAVRKLVEANT